MLALGACVPHEPPPDRQPDHPLAQQPAQPTQPAQQGPTPTLTPAQEIAAQTQAMLAHGRVDPPPAAGTPPLGAPPAAEPTTEEGALSDENDFQQVERRRDIASDAAQLAHNRRRYRVIPATDLPERPETPLPNIVAYAVQTTNPLGQPLYRRQVLGSAERRQARYEENCALFLSDGAAQEEFLARGGPERDPLDLDPDGDGFACAWDPTPFRLAVRR